MNKPENDAAPAGTWQRQGGAGMAGSQRWASLVATLFLVAAGSFTLKEFLPALAWTVIFAIALLPFFQKLGARWPRHKKELLPGLFVLGVVLVFVIPLLVIAVPLAADAHAAVQWVQLVQQSGLPAPAFLAKLPHGDELTALWAQKIGQPGQISVLTKGALKGGGAKVAGDIGRETLHRLVLFGFTLLGLFFFLRDSEVVIRELQAGSRRAFGAAGEDVGGAVDQVGEGGAAGLHVAGGLQFGNLVFDGPRPGLCRRLRWERRAANMPALAHQRAPAAADLRNACHVSLFDNLCISSVSPQSGSIVFQRGYR